MASFPVRLAALALATLPPGIGLAATAGERDAVVVTAQRNPVDKSYRRMIRGMDLFEEMRERAPRASLRYKLLPRKPDTRMEAIALNIVADSFEIPVRIAADRTFTLERNQDALREDASVRPNRKAGTMTWRTEVRTPGLPAHVRRLGDLRLECHVGMEAGLVSEDPPSLMGALMGALRTPEGFCNDRDVRYLFFAERPLFGVTLRSGARAQTLSYGQLYAGIGHGRTPPEDLRYCDCEALLDRTYFLPLGDRSWPDDTLVELEYMDAVPPPAAQDDSLLLTGLATKADVIALLGQGMAMRFDSGFEVWGYEYGAPEQPRLGRIEYVILFDRDGTVLKTRGRR